MLRLEQEAVRSAESIANSCDSTPGSLGSETGVVLQAGVAAGKVDVGFFSVMSRGEGLICWVLVSIVWSRQSFEN